MSDLVGVSSSSRRKHHAEKKKEWSKNVGNTYYDIDMIDDTRARVVKVDNNMVTVISSPMKKAEAMKKVDEYNRKC